ncbi:hypothetical protein [Micromonospora avicenniae]|uniref:hypothetical protein n=1 Tax=Micromonospora avicenniae TaxID=1198245 RepID=UPI003435B553
MSYRDWGRGESGPHAREPIASWDEAVAPAPADPYLPDERPGPPSHRPARGREQDEPVDAYLPRWAVDSGIRRPDGGGRHAAPDDDGDDAVRQGSGAGWRTDRAGGRRRAHETSRREVPSPELEHTAEWTFDRPQEQGYVGSRRADPADDTSFGSIAARRPRRSSAGLPQVIWSGGEEFSTEEPTAPRERERPGRRARSARKGESRPAVDAWDRAARRAEETEPAYRPAVDPWDASGIQAVPTAAEVDPWDASGVHAWPAVGGDRGRGTGQWEHPESAGHREQPDHTAGWERYADVDRWDRTESSLTAPRPRSMPGAYEPSRRRTDPIGAPRGTGRTPPRRRVGTVASNDWTRRLENDLLDADPGGTLRSLLYTTACYLIPAVLVFAWLLTLDAQPPAGCVTDITGGGCDSPRAHALGSLIAGAPRYGVALASSLVVAALLRRVGTTWRSTTVALASAVVGGGLSTVLISAVTGQPIG